MSSLKILVAQINLWVGDIEGNAQKVIEEAKRAYTEHQADIIVFPEMTISGYPPEDLLMRLNFFTRCQNALNKIQEENIPITIILGYPEKINNLRFNKAAIIQNGHIVKTYSKQCLPNYTVFDELRYFSAGNTPCVFKIKNVNVGVLICEDLWFPEPTQQAVAAGAEIIVCLNASPFDRNKARAREKLISERARSAKTPIVYANLVGGQDELVFDGGSMATNQDGVHCQQAAYYKEDRMLVEFELSPHPILIPKTLPPRLSDEENIYKALTLGVADYIHKNKFPSAVLGLSGGIDSALTLAIACDAIGAEAVQAILMPSRYTATMSIEDAKLQAETQHVKYQIIDIEPIFNSYLETFTHIFSDSKADVTEQNIQARIRGNLLMAISNKTGAIVLTTGNKSELSVGYSTLYGDMAGGFCVLKDVPKTLVYQLAEYRNLLSPVIPKRVLERPPSAELASGQTDQDLLPPYPILDEIIYLYVEKDKDPAQIYSDRLKKETVDRVVAMINRNEYKRRQAPIGIRITDRAFGKDRRYPITSGYGQLI
jgi:NAD+ synthase (glutamine-hydrolysing)